MARLARGRPAGCQAMNAISAVAFLDGVRRAEAVTGELHGLRANYCERCVWHKSFSADDPK
jgi:hypothetical protein